MGSGGGIAGARWCLILFYTRFGIGVKNEVKRLAFVNARYQRHIDVHNKASVIGMTVTRNGVKFRSIITPGVSICRINDRTVKVIIG